MTATAPDTTLTTTTSTTSNDVSHSTTPTARQSWACNTCHISFDDGQAQREHMKGPWHVYNLQRRIAALPPISSEVFKDRVQTEPKAVEIQRSKEIVEEAEQDTASPRQCLFCAQKFEDDSDGLENTLEHMSTVHGLFVPNHDLILNVESFLGYLATEVRIWHECLYCGTIRDSTQAVQSHMRDSNHCMLNLEREPELLEFWETRSEDEDHAGKEVALSGMRPWSELHLPSEKLVGSRRISSRKPRASRVAEVSLTLRHDHEASMSPEPPRHQASRQLARRDEMGIRNISPQQRNALILVQKRSQKDEAIASRAREWSYARKANSQKHDQAHGPLSWAKGGLHNLLPR